MYARSWVLSCAVCALAGCAEYRLDPVDTDTSPPAEPDPPSPDPDGVPEDSPLDCGADYAPDTPEPGWLGGCVTQEVGCGEEVLHTLEGGDTLYDRSFWEAQQALGGLVNHSADALDGPERVYVIRPDTPGRSVEVRVESCFDAWASWRRYADVAFEWCDVDDHWATAGHFGGKSPRVRTYPFLHQENNQYEIIVEGLDGAVGNFRLVVECK